MITRARFYGLIAFAFMLGGSHLFGTTIPPAATPCTNQTLDQYVSLGVGGCSLGGVFDANSFTFSTSGGPLGAADITITPTVMIVGGTVVNINFNFSGDFSNNTSGPITYTIDYILDPRPPVINGASLALDPSGVLTEDICAGGIFISSVCQPPGTSFFDVLVATGAITTASTAFPSSVSTVEYHLVLTLQPGDSAGGFDSGSVTGLGAGGNDVPEPISGSLTTAGLVGLLAFRSRAKLRQIVLQLFARV